MGVAGRPVGSTGDRTWHKAIVRAVNRRTEGKGSPKRLDVLANRLVKEGMNGNVQAINAIGDRLDGKPSQAIAIKGDPDSPVVFNLRLGDGMVDGGMVETIATEPLTAPLVAIAVQDDDA